MIGIMIGEQQGFAQNRLSLAVRYFGGQISTRIRHQMDHFEQIALEGRYALVPSLTIGRRRCFWPVTGWKRRRDVFWISAELQDIPLREPRMFEQLPARMRQTIRERSIFLWRESFQRIHEVYVRASAFQQIGDLFAQLAIYIARRLLRYFLGRFFVSFFDGLFLFHSGFPEISTC